MKYNIYIKLADVFVQQSSLKLTGILFIVQNALEKPITFFEKDKKYILFNSQNGFASFIYITALFIKKKISSVNF